MSSPHANMNAREHICLHIFKHAGVVAPHTRRHRTTRSYRQAARSSALGPQARLALFFVTMWSFNVALMPSGSAGSAESAPSPNSKGSRSQLTCPNACVRACARTHMRMYTYALARLHACTWIHVCHMQVSVRQASLHIEQRKPHRHPRQRQQVSASVAEGQGHAAGRRRLPKKLV